MRKYAQERTRLLLAKLAEEIQRAAEAADPDAIHDLRVAVRRLSRCLRAFAQFYPGRSWKKARAQLADLLHAAGAVRDRDIALELLAEAGIGVRARVVIRLKAERARAQRELLREVLAWRDRDRVKAWREDLAV